MRFHLMPREESFFDLLEKASENLNRASKLLIENLRNPEDLDLSAREMPNIVGNIPPGPGEALDQNHILPYWQRHVPLIEAGVDAFWPDEGDR